MHSIETNTKEEGKETMEKVARENFVLWNKALLTKNPSEVAKLYSEEATFLPTMSSDFKNGQEEAKEYFEHFLQKDPEGKVVLEAIQRLGENCYLHSGMYDFEVGANGSRDTVEARFSFVWKKEAGEWKIIHHHSSVKPQ